MRGRPWSSTRIWVEDCGVADIAQLSLPAPDPTDDPWVSFCHPNDPPRLSADVTVTWHDGEETYVRVDLTTTNPHFGGVRLWYLCPSCDRRAAKLYATEEGKRLGCLKCLGLVYQCQYRKGWRWALWRWVRKSMKGSPATGRR